MTMGPCPACGAEYADVRAYCGKCGFAVGRPCGQCGATVPIEDAFCLRCGKVRAEHGVSRPAADPVTGRADVSPGAPDFLAEVEKDRARFARLAPRLGQQDITRIFNASESEDVNG
jgi:hypothetical protein